MRAVGQALGCEAMSLYKHVDDKQALLRLLVERVAAEMRPPDPTAAWDDRLRHTAREWRRVALAHPHVFPLLATAPPPSPAPLVPIIDATLGALREAANDEAAISYFWAFLAYTAGALIAECAAIAGDGPPSGSGPRAIDADRFPHLALLGPAIATTDLAAEYERGLEILIKAVRSPAE